MGENNQIGQTEQNNIRGLCGIVLGVSSVLLFFGSLANQHGKEDFLVVCLFALPVLAQLIGLGFIYWKPHIRSFSTYYACMMFACVFTTYVAWGAYNIKALSSTHGYLWSILSLGAIVVITAFVVVMTIAIMREQNANDANVKESKETVGPVRERLINLKTDVQKEPFLALLLFFSAFLCVSYLFGLAFAFYDRTLPQNGKPALFMRNLYPQETEGTDGRHQKDSTKVVDERSSDSYQIHFKTARGIPDIEDIDLKKNLPNILKQKADEILETVKRRSQNFDNLKSVVTKIENATQNDGRIRIVLTGRADDTSTKGTPYSSNYELSQARAQNVEMKILETLTKGNGTPENASPPAKWRNIEWVIIPLSNEPAVLPAEVLFSLKNPRVPTSVSSGQNSADNRVVDIRIEPVSEEITALQMQHMRTEKGILPYKQLDLMDYVYFANYTITTTGYGDIMPTTPYSKFLCSLANICEVFFLVVFFNTLLSLRSSGQSTLRQTSAPKGNAKNTGPLRSILEWLRIVDSSAKPK